MAEDGTVAQGDTQALDQLAGSKALEDKLARLNALAGADAAGQNVASSSYASSINGDINMISAQNAQNNFSRTSTMVNLREWVISLH